VAAVHAGPTRGPDLGRARRAHPGPSKCSASHSAVRPLAESPNSGGRKLGHNFEPTQADPGLRERDACHKSPVQARCSRFQLQGARGLKSLGSASSPGVQIALPRWSEGLLGSRTKLSGEAVGTTPSWAEPVLRRSASARATPSSPPPSTKLCAGVGSTGALIPNIQRRLTEENRHLVVIARRRAPGQEVPAAEPDPDRLVITIPGIIVLVAMVKGHRGAW
jgi:hypothetical protein